ncbi:MAG: hypothetical protein ACKOPG_12255 [Novosphingobium sp.]
MGWYETMGSMYANPDCDAVGARDINIGERAIIVCLTLLSLVAANHVYRLQSGAVSWFGYQRISGSDAPEWMHTPLSTNMTSEGIRLGLPMPAQEGQEIVVHYTLNAKGPASAQLYVTCGFPCSNRKMFWIKGLATGEFTMPVTDGDFYSLKVSQGLPADRSPSEGAYWFGVRKARTQ